MPNKTIPFARIVYKYNPPISLTLCNYSKELKKLNPNDLDEKMKMDCNCKNSRFNYSPLGHVVTGNLDLHVHTVECCKPFQTFQVLEMHGDENVLNFRNTLGYL